MRLRDVNEQSSVRHTAQTDRSAQPPITSPSRMHPNISTERIMQAVEQQRRISQELEDLCSRQRQREVVLRKTGIKLSIGVSFLVGALVGSFLLLALFQPDLLVRLLTWLGDTIAVLIAVVEGIKIALSLIPLNSWLLSGVALLLVLLTGAWLRLMRYPREE